MDVGERWMEDGRWGNGLEDGWLTSFPDVARTPGAAPAIPAHPSSAEHQRRWQAQDHVRLDRDQGCWSPLL